MKKAFKSILAVFFCIMMITATASSASAVGKPTLKVKAVTYNSVALYWTAVSGADYYQIQRSTDAKNWTNLNTALKATTYTDAKSLTTGRAYAYRVRAVDKGLLKTTYGSWVAVTAKPLPAKVTGFKVKATGYNAVQLVWNKVAGANGYTVQHLSGSTWKTYKSTTSNTLLVSPLTLGKTYSFRVLAYRTVSKKAVYGPASATVKAGPTLNAPTTVVLSGINSSALKITWNASNGAKGYEIYIDSTKKWTNVGTSKTYTYTGLKAGTKYKIVVRPYSGSYKGKQSNIYTFQTAATSPSGIKVMDATDTTLTYTWNKVTGAAGYQAQWYDYATAKWTTLPATTTNSIKITGLKGNTQYGFRIRTYVKNSNVYKISATTYSGWSGNVKGSTAIGAPTLTVKSADTTTINLSWTAVSGAKAYSVEKYNPNRAMWYIYDFSNGEWKSPAAITESSKTTTTARTLSDSGASARADLYRVRGIDASGKNGTPSKELTGCTTNVAVSANTDSLFNIRQPVKWPAVPGAKTYRIFVGIPYTEAYVDYAVSELTALSGGAYYQKNLYLAPNSVHTIMVIGLDANGRTIDSATDWLTFKVGAVPQYASNHSYYKHSVNSQLLYVARAINNTKKYSGEITVKNASSVSYKINYLKMPWYLSVLIGGPIDGVCDTPDEVEKLFKAIDSSEDAVTSSTENYNETLTFRNGEATKSDGSTAQLWSYIEPTAGSTKTAYIYNSKTYDAWTKGFESVKTVKNSDGGYTISFTIKKESSKSDYHNGLLSSFNAADFNAAGGFDVQKLEVGKTTVTATIGPDGILKSYKANSPYTATFVAGFTAEEDSDDGNIHAGDSIEMTMGMSGSTNVNYTFTK